MAADLLISDQSIVARDRPVAYSHTSDTGIRPLVVLFAACEGSLHEARHLAELCDAVSDMPGRHSEVDPDNTGRKATAGPGRPTEDAALDEARQHVSAELATARKHLTYALALLRGTAAALDRALARWEGEPVSTGSDVRGDADRSADHGHAAGGTSGDGGAAGAAPDQPLG